MAQPAATRPASSAPPCFPSWSGGPTRRLAPTLEALAAQPPGLRPETASQPPPPATPSPEADRHQEPEARCPARASTGGHRGGRRSGLPGLRTQAGAHTTYRSRGSLRRQPGSPRPLRNHLPAATGAAGFRFRFPAGRRRSWRVRRSPFLPPPTILSHFGGWGGEPQSPRRPPLLFLEITLEGDGSVLRRLLSGGKPGRAASLGGKAVSRPCPLPHPPPRRGVRVGRPTVPQAKRRGGGVCVCGFRLRSPEASLVNSPWAASAL